MVIRSELRIKQGALRGKYGQSIKRVVAFVESPLQLSNLIDIAGYFSEIHFVVYVRSNGSLKNDVLINSLLSSKKTNVEFLTYFLPKSGVLKSILVFRLLFFVPTVIKSCGVLFFDDRGLVFRVFRRLAKSKTIFSDDGAYSFVKIDQLERSNNSGLLAYITRFSSIRSESINIIHLPFKRIKVIPKNYAIIIGVPLVEKGIISREFYRKILSSASSYLEGRLGLKVYYCPHRSECNVEDLGFPLIEPESSIEDYIESQSQNSPSCLFSMYSTALFFAADRFDGLKIFYYEIPSDKILKRELVSSIEVVYAALRNSSVNRLPSIS